MGSGNKILIPPPDFPRRRDNYGAFSGVSEIDQQIKLTLRQTPNWRRLSPDQQTALEMIAQKLARILNGDPDYSDSWHDIGGYAILVANRLDGAGPT